PVFPTRGQTGLDQQTTEFGIHGFGHAVLNDAPGNRALAVQAVIDGAINMRNKVGWGLLPRSMCRAIADSGHPGPMSRPASNPFDGGIGFDSRAIPARAWVCECDFLYLTFFNNDQRGNVVAVFTREIERGRWCTASLMRNENAAGIQTLQAGRILHKRCALDECAAVIRLIARARFGAASSSGRDEAATVRALRCYTSRRRIY